MADASPAEPARILMVEDAAEQVRLVRDCLAGEPFDLRHAATGREAFAALDEETPDAVLLDLGLPDMDGRDVLRHVLERDPAASVVVLTGNARLDVAVAAMRLGAFDYLVKPVDPAHLAVTLRNAVERRRLSRLVSRFRERYESDHFHGFIGASPAMRAVYRTIEAAAESKATIFITGESGTGKELCAAAIHDLSARRDKPFVVLNCGAIPAGLIESELFGHVRGAFTGATAERNGAVARADGGTLFFDEICEMPLELQTKLLRLVQTGTFRKVGGDNDEAADVRFVCATNKEPKREVDAGRFREDLYYRLHVIPIELPPLRDRGDDVMRLAARFLAEFAQEEGKSFAGFAPDAAAAIAANPWPGNVRELQNVIRQVVVLNDGVIVRRDMLPEKLTGAAAASRRPNGGEAGPVPMPGADGASIKPLRIVEQETIEQAIASCGGNLGEAAERLGIDRTTIYRKRLRWRAS